MLAPLPSSPGIAGKLPQEAILPERQMGYTTSPSSLAPSLLVYISDKIAEIATMDPTAGPSRSAANFGQNPPRTFHYSPLSPAGQGQNWSPSPLRNGPATSDKRSEGLHGDLADDGSDHTPGAKRQRTAKACESCRNRRVKCSGEIPCRNCKETGIAEQCIVRVKARPNRLVEISFEGNNAERQTCHFTESEKLCLGSARTANWSNGGLPVARLSNVDISSSYPVQRVSPTFCAGQS